MDGRFVQENDSLKIIYSFYGENAPVSIEIHNKLDEPLLIDWQRSALTYNDSAVSYAGNSANLNADINSASYNWGTRWSTSNGNINGTITLPQYSDFIPPHSFVKRTPLQLMDVFVNSIPDTAFKKVKLPTNQTDVPTVKGKSVSFTKENTPLVFNSYLTIVSNNSDKKVSYQQQFYIAEIINTNTNPDNIALYDLKSGDRFYVSEKTGYGKTAPTVGAIVAIGAVAALSESINHNNNNNNRKN
ncbi:hypothetical protein FLA_5995 [Filimonas lacunae]|nr:hypothetical protein FLA_5995 [Filimonas lacunae]